MLRTVQAEPKRRTGHTLEIKHDFMDEHKSTNSTGERQLTGKPKLSGNVRDRGAGTNTAAHQTRANPSQRDEATLGETKTEFKPYRRQTSQHTQCVITT